MDYKDAKAYEMLEFCKHVNCQSIRKPKEKLCLKEFCPAYQFHTYLREHRQIIEEGSDLAKVIAEVERLRVDMKRYEQWVNDLQSGMYVNCVYCGHRYGPEDEIPSSMADALKEHIEHCPEHPMSKLKAENAALKAIAKAAKELIGAINDADACLDADGYAFAIGITPSNMEVEELYQALAALEGGPQ